MTECIDHTALIAALGVAIPGTLAAIAAFIQTLRVGTRAKKIDDRTIVANVKADTNQRVTDEIHSAVNSGSEAMHVEMAALRSELAASNARVQELMTLLATLKPTVTVVQGDAP
jgi:hypothetical protein